MTTPTHGEGAIFVLPTTTAGQRGPVAGWISTAGWAGAAERELGRAWIATPNGVLSVAEVRARASRAAGPLSQPQRHAGQRVPTVLKTLVKDAREAWRARRFTIDRDGPWSQTSDDVAFVWQRHELFHHAGLDLAGALGVPSVVFVPALTVWQAERWGVHRPGWGPWLEQHAEAPALRQATLVACGTDVIAAEVARLGVPEERVLITPTGVDLGLFARPADAGATRRALELDETFVVGWAGSFRGFHQVDQLVRAVAPIAGMTLLLVGDGPERAGVEQLARSLGVRARFTGMVPYDEMPGLLAAMDVGVVLARDDEPFHYSPLKVAEYLATGLPVVAPDAPQLLDRLVADGDAVFYRSGDERALTDVLRRLQAEPDRCAALAAGARAAARSFSWDRQVRRVVDALSDARSRH